MLVPPLPAAGGAFGTTTAGSTQGVFVPTTLHFMIGAMLTNSVYNGATHPGEGGVGQDNYNTTSDATVAPIAAATAPRMLYANDDRKGVHYGAQPIDYNMGESPHNLSARFLPGGPATRRRRALNANSAPA